MEVKYLWVQMEYIFVAFFLVRFSHDGLQETCHIAHACRSVLCSRDPPEGPKK